jgi:peroxiredoxin
MLKLPMFDIVVPKLIKRVALIAKIGIIVKVFYLVFSSDRNADEVIDWLRNNAV